MLPADCVTPIMSEKGNPGTQTAWVAKKLPRDLCAIYGHSNCGGHEVNEKANIIFCTCWCHREIRAPEQSDAA